MMAAYSRVVANKGAPGVDDMPVTALKGYSTGRMAAHQRRTAGGEVSPATGAESRNTETGRRHKNAGNTHRP